MGEERKLHDPCMQLCPSKKNWGEIDYTIPANKLTHQTKSLNHLLWSKVCKEVEKDQANSTAKDAST